MKSQQTKKIPTQEAKTLKQRASDRGGFGIIMAGCGNSNVHAAQRGPSISPPLFGIIKSVQYVDVPAHGDDAAMVMPYALQHLQTAASVGKAKHQRRSLKSGKDRPTYFGII